LTPHHDPTPSCVRHVGCCAVAHWRAAIVRVPVRLSWMTRASHASGPRLVSARRSAPTADRVFEAKRSRLLLGTPVSGF
jgi:hypothetical protein